MTDSPSQKPGTDSTGDDAGDEDSLSPWVEFVPLFWGVVASALLHAGIFGALHYVSQLDIDLDANLEWLEGDRELTGLGQRSQDRFAEVQPPPPEPEQKEESELPEIETSEELEEALSGEYEPPEPQPEPEPVAKAEPEPEPEADPEEEPQPEPEPEPKPEDAPEPKARQKSAAQQSLENLSEHAALDREGPNNLPDMRSLAPGNARVTALIRLHTIRDEPYADVIGKVLRAVPDARLLFGDPDFEPVRDIDTFFMASPDPRYVQNTFLAVRHRLSTERVRRLLDSRYPEPPTWRKFRDYPIREVVPDNPHYRDPRRILLAGDGLALLAHKRLLEPIVEPLPDKAPLVARATGRDKPADGESTGEGATADNPSLLEALGRIHRVARRDDAIVILNFRGLTLALPGVGRLQGLRGLRMAVTRPEEPTLDVDLKFANPRQATRFADRCPRMRQAILDAIPFAGALGVGELIQRLTCRAENDYVNVHAEFTPAEVERLANMAAPFVPRPPALSQLPEPPEPEPADQPDAGPSDQADVGTNDVGVENVGGD